MVGLLIILRPLVYGLIMTILVILVVLAVSGTLVCLEIITAISRNPSESVGLVVRDK